MQVVLSASLSGILSNWPLKVLRQMPNSNGFEVWGQLRNLCAYAPKTKARSLTILSALMGCPTFNKDRTMWEQIQNLERISDEYRKASGQDITDDILLSTLVRVLPRHIQQHVKLGMDGSSTLQQVRERVLAYGPVS